jgi:hypothetical protein
MNEAVSTLSKRFIGPVWLSAVGSGFGSAELAGLTPEWHLK